MELQSMKKVILLLLVVITLHAYGEGEDANWKTCTVKATKMTTYQSGEKISESNISISITLDKSNNTIRIDDRIYNVEGKEIVKPQVHCFQCYHKQSLEKYIIICDLKSYFIMIGSKKDENAPIKNIIFLLTK